MSSDTAATTATAGDGDEAVLRGEGVTKQFGGLVAVDGVDFAIHPGEIVALIGPNGAGKSTLFNCVTGTLQADAGRVYLEGEDVTDWSEHRIARAGVARTFQQTRIFGRMSVVENVLVSGRVDAGLRSTMRRPAESTREAADDLLEYVSLDGLRDVRAGRLSFGQQKLLEFAMALMAEPHLLLMDEPAGGINPSMIERLLDFIRDANRERETTIFLIEHDMDFVMEIADRIYVLAHGERIAVGTPEEIQHDERVLDAYLGRE